MIDGRYNLKDSIGWLLNSIFNLDHGFFYTTVKLIKKPGEVIGDVLNGVTIKYTHPFRLLFLWATISTILVVVLGTYDAQTSDMYQNFDFSEDQIEFQKKMNEVLKKYLNFVIMLNVPIIAFFSWLFYRKHKLNYTEHLIINSYAFVTTTSLGVILVFAQYFLDNPSSMIWFSMLVNVALVGYVYSSFFKENYFASFFKYLAAFLLSYIGLMIISAIGVIVYFIATGKG
tara:strand:+ start:1072 stop:1758 length:687 start_codon:yes stop_codon:yes gene_type:complete